ncbi:hypothetical protein FRC17_000495 [Serendipita sp. 399]|nr:hypothetical protein FRC17_000495 [Serendipita sp. 399]
MPDVSSDDEYIDGTEEKPLVLTGDKAAAWELLLGLQYDTIRISAESLTAEQFLMILPIANKYRMERVERDIIQELKKSTDYEGSVNLVVASRIVGSDELYQNGIQRLISFGNSPDLMQATRMGTAATHAVMEALIDALKTAYVAEVASLKTQTKGELAAIKAKSEHEISKLNSEITTIESRATEEKQAIRTKAEEEKAAIRSKAKEDSAAIRSKAEEEKTAIRSKAKEDIAAIKSKTEEEKTAVRSKSEEEKAALRSKHKEEIAALKAKFYKAQRKNGQ